MENKDWTLLAIAAAGTRGLTPVHLQKSLFLLSRNLDRSQLSMASPLYDFQPYDYGPFDSAVYRDAEALATAGLVLIADSYKPRTYLATEAGIGCAAELRHRAGAPAVRYLDEVVRWVLSQRFGELVRAIYENYPEMRQRSVFRE